MFVEPIAATPIFGKNNAIQNNTAVVFNNK
jgi:hypothetical protein